MAGGSAAIERADGAPGWACELDPAGIPGALARFRLLQSGGRSGAALPLAAGPEAPPDGVAVFGMVGAGGCFALKGLSEGRVAVLAWPEGATRCW
jgi:hypothetical protein